jgi:hypothetical protein
MAMPKISVGWSDVLAGGFKSVTKDETNISATASGIVAQVN